MPTPAVKTHPDTLRTLPGDDIRQLMWRFADRYDLQMLVQSARGVARGPVARLVAERRPERARVDARARTSSSPHYDASGITAAFMEPEEGGFISGPKNLALALTAFELAWVDAGAATGALAGLPRPLAHPRARHARAAAPLHEPRRAREARRGPQALARRVRAHRAHPLRRRRHRHAEREGARRRVEGGRGAGAAGREARPVHHEHGLRELRDRRGGHGRSAHQVLLPRHPRGDRSRARSTAARPRRSSSTSSRPRTIRSSACACPPPASSAATP